MTDFIPKGFIGLPKAIWFLANRFDQQLWSAAEQDVRELGYWEYLREENDAKWLEDRIRYRFFRDGEAMPDAASSRIDSYYAAEKRLREALYADSIKAYFVSAAPGSAGQLQHILPQGWGTDAGQDILWHGRADLEGEPSPRMIFVDAYSLRTLFFPDQEAPASAGEAAFVASTPSAAPRRRGRPPAYDWSAARQKAFEHLEYHGMPNPDDPDLSSQAVLEQLIAEFLTTADRSPSESQVREYVARWLSDFAKGAS